MTAGAQMNKSAFAQTRDSAKAQKAHSSLEAMGLRQIDATPSAQTSPMKLIIDNSLKTEIRSTTNTGTKHFTQPLSASARLGEFMSTVNLLIILCIEVVRWLHLWQLEKLLQY